MSVCRRVGSGPEEVEVEIEVVGGEIWRGLG